MPETTTRPPALVVRSARSSALFEPVHSSATSTPPSRNSCPRSGVSLTRARVPPHGLRGVLGPDDLVGAGQPGGRALLLVLGRHDHVSGLGEELERDQRQDADRAGADHEHGLAGRDVRARFAAWIAHANGSSSTATSFEMASGTAYSCERWATIKRAQPPPVSVQ